MYHIVDQPRTDREKKYCCLPECFLRQMKFLSQSDYSLINLDDIDEILSGKKVMNNTGIAVTFDDGFEDFHQNAFPVLKQFDIPATLFMISERVGDTNDNDLTHRHDSPKRILLTQEQLLEVSQSGILIGSHTRTHPKLNEISADKENLNDELLHSRQVLENQLNKTVEHFAYPYGLLNDDVVNMVKQTGYRTACSTRSGFNRLEIDPFLLRRIEVFGSDNLWQFKQKLKFGTNDMPITFHLKYYFSRLINKFFKN